METKMEDVVLTEQNGAKDKENIAKGNGGKFVAMSFV
jgi:hypothetical protein